MPSGWEISGMLGSRSVRVQGVHLSIFSELGRLHLEPDLNWGVLAGG